VQRLSLFVSLAVAIAALPPTALAAPPAPTAVPAPVLDQSFIGVGGEGLGLAREFYWGQTFTAGRTGQLAGVNVDIQGYSSSPLVVQIREVANGLPTSVVLGESVLDSSSANLDRLITFPTKIDIVAGVQYAIVARYDGLAENQSGGSWTATNVGNYAGGSTVFFTVTDNRWTLGIDDAHFRTYVDERPPAPTSKDQCKSGGWRAFPGFRHQGDCVSFIATGGRNQPAQPPTT
jgi:hypothetical protein